MAGEEPAGPAVLEPAVVHSVEEKQEPRLTPRYKVLIHNDEITVMDFVVFVLLQVFKKNAQDAVSIMSEAHHTGVALVTVLPLEEAELRVDQAHSLARAQKFPLTFSIEPE